MARSHATRRLATIAATGALAGLATLAAAGSASAATTPTPSTAASSSICVVTSLGVPIVTPQSGVCTEWIVEPHEGLLTSLLEGLL